MTAPTGPLKDLTVAERHDAVLMSVFFIGILQILVSWLRLAQYTKLLPQSTMIGFVNGLAIVIFESQLPAFKRCSPPPGENYLFSECPSEYLHFLTFYDAELLWVLLIFALCSAASQIPPAGSPPCVMQSRYWRIGWPAAIPCSDSSRSGRFPHFSAQVCSS